MAEKEVTTLKARETLGLAEKLEKRKVDLGTLVGQIEDMNKQISMANQRVGEMTAQANMIQGSILELEELLGEHEPVEE